MGARARLVHDENGDWNPKSKHLEAHTPPQHLVLRALPPRALRLFTTAFTQSAGRSTGTLSLLTPLCWLPFGWPPVRASPRRAGGTSCCWLSARPASHSRHSPWRRARMCTPRLGAAAAIFGSGAEATARALLRIWRFSIQKSVPLCSTRTMSGLSPISHSWILTMPLRERASSKRTIFDGASTASIYGARRHRRRRRRTRSAAPAVHPRVHW